MKAERRYLAVAHRGASAYEPENTLRAFQRAMDLGADMSELDTHMSRDGQVVIMHNATVEKTTNGQGAIADMTLEQLKALDAGKGERIPTLQEVVDLVRGKNGLYIELKGEGTPGPVVEVLRRNDFTGHKQVIVGSFLPWLVQQTRELAPEIATSLLVGPVYSAAELIAMTRSARSDFVHLCWEARAPQPHKLLTPELLRDLRAAGLGIVLWHEERPAELAVLRTLDIDAICSNTPDQL
ncbi:MAG: glycerophosphodiester phosphodiesterase family protein [Chloroflexota bacterium]|nr:glycerophosphodiester phosphodiesterase family protein [Chloroflexota bacterium]